MKTCQNLTTNEVIEQVRKHKPGFSIAAFYRAKRKAGVEQVGGKLHRPAIFRADAVDLILAELGLAPAPKSNRLVSLRKLRRAA